MALDWVTEFQGAVTVCDAVGIILEMNETAITVFADYGGRALIGTNLLDCHPEPSRSKLRTMLELKQTNVYTIEKNGKRKLIYQAPWYEEGQYRGLVEVALPLPDDVPHFNRDG
jgi:hypothetical protein